MTKQTTIEPSKLRPVTFSTGETVLFKRVSAMKFSILVDGLRRDYERRTPKPAPPMVKRKVAAGVEIESADTSDKTYISLMQAWESNASQTVGTGLMRYLASQAVLTNDQAAQAQELRDDMEAATGVALDDSDAQLFVLGVAMRPGDYSTLIAVAGDIEAEAEKK